MRWSAQPNQEEKEVGFPVYISAGFRFNFKADVVPISLPFPILNSPSFQLEEHDL